MENFDKESYHASIENIKGEITDLRLVLEELNSNVNSLSKRLDEFNTKKYQTFFTRLKGSLLDCYGRLKIFIRRMIFIGNNLLNRDFYEANINLIESSELFEPKWYRWNNPSLKKTHKGLMTHFLFIGGFIGSDPGPFFNCNNYLNQYEDVRFSGMNPLIHYLRFGVEEGRSITPPIDESELISDKNYLDNQYLTLLKKHEL